jgi:hypothetical protein
LDRSRKREDLGAGVIKMCILGILSSDQFEDGASANRILRALPRTQAPDRLKSFLEDLYDRGLIERKDLSFAHDDLRIYKIKQEGKKVLEKYFDQEFRDVTSLLDGVKATTYSDVKTFWQKYGRSFQKS